MKIEKAAILALGLVIAVPAAGYAKNGRPAPGKAEGTLTAVNATATPPTVTITGRTAITVNVTPATKIEINERHVALADLVIGDRAEAKFDPATMNATQVEEVVPATPTAAQAASARAEATGTVLSADPVAGQVALDVNGDGVVDATLIVDATTEVKLGNVKLAAAELALLDGLTVKAEFNSTTFQAKEIKADSHAAVQVSGTFTSFDAATGTLVMATAAGPETLAVPADVKLKGSGKLTLATIPAGSTLVVQQLVNGAGANIALSINVKGPNRGGSSGSGAGSNSGSGSGGNDDPPGDDHGNGGHGADDPPGDDHGGGHGGHGGDDGPGHH